MKRTHITVTSTYSYVGFAFYHNKIDFIWYDETAMYMILLLLRLAALSSRVRLCFANMGVSSNHEPPNRRIILEF